MNIRRLSLGIRWGMALFNALKSCDHMVTENDVQLGDKFGDHKMSIAATIEAADVLRIFLSPGLPTAWVIENETTGRLWIAPAVERGYSRRVPFRGHRESLRETSGSAFMGLGVPLRRPWREVCLDPSGRN